jgi:hypothetical protein
MTDGTDTGAPAGARGTRLALFLACFVPLVVLLGMLLVASPSEGATMAPLTVNALAELEAEEEDEEWEGWEEEVAEEWEEEEAEAGATQHECPLRSARAHAVTKPDKLKLTIGYTTYEPFNARVEIKQGSTRIDSVQRHFERSGVLRLSSKLSEQRKGARFIVRIKPAPGGSECPSRRLVLFPR